MPLKENKCQRSYFILLRNQIVTTSAVKICLHRWIKQHLSSDLKVRVPTVSYMCGNQNVLENNGILNYSPCGKFSKFCLFKEVKKFWLGFTMVVYEKIYYEVYINELPIQLTQK